MQQRHCRIDNDLRKVIAASRGRDVLAVQAGARKFVVGSGTICDVAGAWFQVDLLNLGNEIGKFMPHD